MTVALQFISSDDFGSNLIKWYEAGDVSHVDVVRPDGTLLGARHDVLDGVPAGVQIRRPGYKKIDLAVRFDIPMTPLQEATFWRAANDQIGKPYDSRAITAFAAGRDWRDPSYWFCSEYAAWLLEVCLWMPQLRTPTNKVMPGPLAMLLSSHGEVRWSSRNHW